MGRYLWLIQELKSVVYVGRGENAANEIKNILNYKLDLHNRLLEILILFVSPGRA